MLRSLPILMMFYVLCSKPLFIWKRELRFLFLFLSVSFPLPFSLLSGLRIWACNQKIEIIIKEKKIKEGMGGGERREEESF